MQTSAPISLLPQPDAAEHKMAAHIRDAANATGVPFDYLLAQAAQESRLNPNAKNRRSSAMGLFQFTAGTWMDMVKRHGGEHGLGQYADAIERGADGRLTVTDKALKKEILDLRRDPKLSALMAGEYAKDNERILEAQLGRQASAHDLYLAHFLGAGGALKVLKGRGQENVDEASTQPMATEMSKAAQANPGLFHDPDSGEPRTASSIYATVERRFQRAMAEASRLADDLSPRVDLASLRPEGRPDPQTDPRAALFAALADSRAGRINGEATPVDLAALQPESRPEEVLAATMEAPVETTPTVAAVALAEVRPEERPEPDIVTTSLVPDEVAAPQVVLASLHPQSRPEDVVTVTEARPDEVAAPEIVLAVLHPEIRPGDAPTAVTVTTSAPDQVTVEQVALAALRPESRPVTETRNTDGASAGSVMIAAASMPDVAPTMADIPADTSAFPTALPERGDLGHRYGSFPAAIRGDGVVQNYPVPMPPPLSGIHANADTVLNLMKLTEKKG